MAERRIWQGGSAPQDMAAPLTAQTKTAARCGAAVTRSAGKGVSRPGKLTRRYAACLIFSAATAKRFEIGWNTSPASFSMVSLFFDVSAIIWSNAVRA
jgi:hypothetical protein